MTDEETGADLLVPKLGIAKYKEVQPHEPMFLPQHERYALARAKGATQVAAAQLVGLNRKNACKWEDGNSRVSRGIVARINYLRMAASIDSIPEIGVLLHRQMQLFEAAFEAGNHKAANDILECLKRDARRAKDREPRGHFAAAIDVPTDPEDLEAALRGK